MLAWYSLAEHLQPVPVLHTWTAWNGTTKTTPHVKHRATNHGAGRATQHISPQTPVARHQSDHRHATGAPVLGEHCQAVAYTLELSTLSDSFPPHPTRTWTTTVTQNERLLTRNHLDAIQVYWRVKATIETGMETLWSHPRHFSLPAPSSPVITSLVVKTPTDGLHVAYGRRVLPPVLATGDCIGQVTGAWLIDGEGQGTIANLSENSRVVSTPWSAYTIPGGHTARFELLSPTTVTSEPVTFFVDRQVDTEPAALQIAMDPPSLTAFTFTRRRGCPHVTLTVTPTRPFAKRKPRPHVALKALKEGDLHEKGPRNVSVPQALQFWRAQQDSNL
jgi:hypothetical protein